MAKAQGAPRRRGSGDRSGWAVHPAARPHSRARRPRLGPRCAGRAGRQRWIRSRGA